MTTAVPISGRGSSSGWSKLRAVKIMVSPIPIPECCEREHKGFRHSDFLHLELQKNWLPFLLGDELGGFSS